MLAALDATEADMGELPFVRVLAMNKNGMEILRLAKESSQIEFGDSLKDLSKLSPAAYRQADLIERASRLQSLCGKSGEGVSEYRRSAVVIKGE